MMQFYKRTADQVIIALPSKGRLKEHVMSFLDKKGYPVVPPKGRQLQTYLKGRENHKVVFIHPRDIAILLQEGTIDIGFTGLDLVIETGVSIRPVVRLGLGKVKLSILVHKDSPWYHPFHLLDRKIGTPFPSLAQAYFDRLKVRATIRQISGASEGMPYLGVVDAIVDVVESGNSAIENGLKIIADDIFDSECICAVNKPEFQSNFTIINQFLRGIYE